MNPTRLRATALLCLIVLAATAAAAAEPDPPTTVLIVRHAEQIADAGDDPPLAPEGRARARALAEVAGAAGVQVIYTTQLQRTRQTAGPLAERLGLPSRDFPVELGDVAGYVAGLAETLRTRHPGETVLVVSHSNTVPLIVQALTGQTVAPIEHSEFDRLYVVTLPPSGPARLIQARYGAPAAGAGHAPASTGRAPAATVPHNNRS